MFSIIAAMGFPCPEIRYPGKREIIKIFYILKSLYLSFIISKTALRARNRGQGLVLSRSAGLSAGLFMITLDICIFVSPVTVICQF